MEARRMWRTRRPMKKSMTRRVSTTMRMMKGSRTPLVMPNRDKLPHKHKRKPKLSSSKGKPSNSSLSHAKHNNNNHSSSSSSLKKDLDSVKLSLNSAHKQILHHLSSEDRLCRVNSSNKKSQMRANTMMNQMKILDNLLLLLSLKTKPRQGSARSARPKRHRDSNRSRSKKRSRELQRKQKGVKCSSNRQWQTRRIERNLSWLSRDSLIRLPVDLTALRMIDFQCQEETQTWD